jgi:hypothetical protein
MVFARQGYNSNWNNVVVNIQGAGFKPARQAIQPVFAIRGDMIYQPLAADRP